MERLLIALNVWVYRMVRGGPMTGSLLLLTTTGRKSGKLRVSPLGYIRDGDGYVVVASNGGRDRMPGWYYNLKAHPDVAVQVGDRRFRAVAQEVDAGRRSQVWEALIRERPRYQGYQQKTSRVIPLIRLTPA